MVIIHPQINKSHLCIHSSHIMSVQLHLIWWRTIRSLWCIVSIELVQFYKGDQAFSSRSFKLSYQLMFEEQLAWQNVLIVSCFGWLEWKLAASLNVSLVRSLRPLLHLWHRHALSQCLFVTGPILTKLDFGRPEDLDQWCYLCVISFTILSENFVFHVAGSVPIIYFF